MTEIMRRLAEGDTKVAVPAEDRGDEIGAMAKAILVFRDAAIENARLESEAERHHAEAERAQAAAAAAQSKAIGDERALSTLRSASRWQSSPARTFPIA